MAIDPVEFKKRLAYEVAAPTGEALARIDEDLQAISELDALAERRRKRLGWGIFGSIMAFVGSICLSAAFPPAGLPLLGICGVSAVITIVLFVKAGKYDLQDRRYQLLTRVLRLISPDLHPAAELSARIDFTSSTHSSKEVRKGEVRGWKTTWHHDPWMSLTGRFLDGTAFALNVTDRDQVRKRWKTGASGKRKHKVKTKHASEFVVRLRPKASKYPRLAEVGSRLEESVQLPELPNLRVKGMRADGRELRLRVALGEWAVDADGSRHKEGGRDGADLAAMMFLSLYHVLLMAKGPAGGAA